MKNLYEEEEFDVSLIVGGADDGDGDDDNFYAAEFYPVSKDDNKGNNK